MKNWLIGKDPGAGSNWRQKEKGTTEDEVVGWHHQLNRHESEQVLGVDDGQGSLVCCSPWSCKELDMTEQLNWKNANGHLSLQWVVVVRSSENFPMFKLDLEKAEEPEIKLPTSTGSLKKQEFQKNIYCFIDYVKAFDCVNHHKFWKILRWEYQTTLPASWEICMQVKKQWLEPDIEQKTGFRLGKEYVKALYCHLAYLTYMQNMSCKMPGWSTSWNQDCQEKYQQPHVCRWYHPYGRKRGRTKEPIDESENREWKIWLKTQHLKN